VAVVSRNGFAGDTFRMSNYRDSAKERVGHVVRAAWGDRNLNAKPGEIQAEIYEKRTPR
jgi:hypothetical protein